MEMEDTLPDIDGSQICVSPLQSQTEEIAIKEIRSRRSAVDDGVIEKIFLVDFMCHPKLEVKLNSSVNFILGQNGSGKSAIMTAIIVALGGKATSTQRAHSLKDFIRTGCSQAEIHLTLSNKGSEAFKVDEYGNCITVVRTIRRDGSTTYKMRASDGTTVSTHKDELLCMLDHFNIQVDNPVCMLSQDTSRHFLHSSLPGAKFKLFMKGTHLEKIANDFAQAKEQQELMKQEIERKTKMLPELQLIATRCESEVQEIENLKNLETKEHRLSLELLWAAVKECEDKATKTEKDLNKEEQKLESIQKKLDNRKELEEATKGKREDATQLLRDVTENVRVVGTKKDELNNRKLVLDREVHDHLKNIRSLQHQMTQWRNEKIQFENRLTEIRNKNPEDTRSKRDLLQQELEGIEKEIACCNDKMQTAQQDNSSKSERKETAIEDQRRARSRVANTQQELRECQESLDRLSTSDHPLSGFDPVMSDIVSALRQKSRQFKQLPKGPIGSFIKVKEQEWCFAIECCIGFGNLCGFIVDNHEDESKFKAIVREVMRRHPRAYFPPCLTSRFTGRPYDVGGKIPQCSYPVLLKMITVSDPDIYNSLIDMCSIDTTLLIESSKEARNVMNRPPNNAKSAYTIEGDQVLHNRYYSNKKERPFGILHASKQDTIEHQKRCLAQMSGKLKDLQAEEASLTQLLQNVSKEQASIKKYISSAQGKKKCLNQSKNEILTKIEELDDANQDGDIATWEKEIEELGDKLKGQEDKVKQVQEIVSEKRRSLEDLEEEKRGDSVYEQEVGTKLETAKDQFKLVGDELHRIVTSITDCQQRQQQAMNKIAMITAALNRDKDDIKLSVLTAEQNCSRIDTVRNPTSIESEITKIQNILKKESHRRTDQEKARQDLVDAMDQFNTTNTAINKEQQALTVLGSSLKLRMDGYVTIRGRIAGRACLYFKNIISRRGYNGTLKFDLEAKKLEIIVKVNKEQATRNIKSLSGGERSFSTVAFIMALWEAMECPFRCLDEFDVFMDLINRRISMQLMLEGAQALQGKQFIFLTPQDMSSLGIKLHNNCSTLRLNAPDRTQKTID